MRKERTKMKKLKKRVCFYKAMLVEILETLCSICLYLETDARRTHNLQAHEHMRSHFNMLKEFSAVLRRDLVERKES